MARVTVALLWHMHQPYYVDLSEGRATMPWVRLHALKDYYDMPALARRFPSVKQTFNLVPCLLDQLDGYVQGTLTDPFLEVAHRGAHELTRDDRLFLLREFFSFNPGSIAGKLPRLEQLRRMRGARPPDGGDDPALAAWREPDFRDLQILFHLAWSGPTLSSRPAVASLIEKGARFTQDEVRSLLEIQREFLGEVASEYEKASSENIIEISATPYYHPILPLLCDTDSSREAQPRLPVPNTPFHHPEDARQQVRLAREAFQRRFGRPLSGMWPSEGALSNASLEILADEGVRWTASDEDLLFASLGAAPRDFEERSRILHRPYIGPKGTYVFFRDHILSDRIGFVYSTWDAKAAASDFMEHIHAIADTAGSEDRVVPVILDGENAWEFYPGNGMPFLSSLFAALAASDRVETRTYSEIVEGAGRRGPAPGKFSMIRAGSWIRADLTTWIGDPVKNRAWDLLAETRAALGPPAEHTAWGRSLLAAEGSDWFWWFGDEHSSAHDAEFDRTFRQHLQNAYALAGREIPVHLGTPLSAPATGPTTLPPTGPISVTLDGRASDYFEWLAAGRIEADLGRGTMSRGGRLLRTLYFGVDNDRLALRIDPTTAPASKSLDGLVVILEVASPAEKRLRVPLGTGPIESGPVHAHLDRVFEALIPLSDAGAVKGKPVEFRILLEDVSGKRLEAVPSEGFVVLSPGMDEIDWMV